MSLAGLRHENGFGPGGTTIAGIGLVKKKLCIINANIGTKKGGVVDYATSLKNLRLCKIATENKLTTINLVESGEQIFQIKILYLIIMVKYLKKCHRVVKMAFKQYQ